MINLIYGSGSITAAKMAAYPELRGLWFPLLCVACKEKREREAAK